LIEKVLFLVKGQYSWMKMMVTDSKVMLAIEMAEALDVIESCINH
jgi:hypothetical protein